MKRILFILLAIVVIVPAILLGRQFIDLDDDFPAPGKTAVTDKAAQIKRGEYLVRAGDCIACHTPRGSEPFSGGRGIETPFGTIYAPNITPDKATGLGEWTADEFWRALHHGRGKDGEFLYPAFPYTEYTKVSREDADAMYTYLQSIPAVERKNKEHDLRFPYNMRLLLAGWRMLYFTPGVYREDNQQTVEWNRGAYLVEGLGHCTSCHTPRNMLGGLKDADFAGGLIPMSNWYAPSLTSGKEAGLGSWDIPEIVALLKTGVSTKGTAFGPMAEVVKNSLQYMTDDDLKAMAIYLQSVPDSGTPETHHGLRLTAAEEGKLLDHGKAIYEQHCVECHRADGRGIPPGYPPLDGNRAITMAVANNPIRAILHGGFPPSTEGNPHPYGMPPFGQMLSDQDVAAVTSYIRNSWSNKAGLVSTVDINRQRTTPLD